MKSLSTIPLALAFILLTVGTVQAKDSPSVLKFGKRQSCSWAGHCAGAKCSTDDDCSDVLTCIKGSCGGSIVSAPNPVKTQLPPAQTTKPESAPCSWAGHCAGASCKSDDECSDVLTCISGSCGGTSGGAQVGGSQGSGVSTAAPSASCSWEGHCAGASCKTADDCSDVLICTKGTCSS